MAEDLFEDPIEMSQGLKADLESDFTNAQVWIEQEILGLLDPDARQVVGKIDACDFLEHFAEIKSAGVTGLGDMAQPQVLGLMFLNKLFGPRYHWGLGIFLLDDYLVAEH